METNVRWVEQYPYGEQQKANSLAEFNFRGYQEKVAACLVKHFPQSMDVGIQISYAVKKDITPGQLEAYINSSRMIRAERKHLLTIGGIVSEYDQISYLQSQKDPDLGFMEMGSKFDELVDGFYGEGLVLAESRQRGDFFQGTSVSINDYGERKYLSIPDLVIIQGNTIRGFGECNFRGRTKMFPETELFVNLLRSKRKALEIFKEVMFDTNRFRLASPDNLQFVQLTRSDFSEAQENLAKYFGWTVIRTPFDFTDIAYQTLLLGRAYVASMNFQSEDDLYRRAYEESRYSVA